MRTEAVTGKKGPLKLFLPSFKRRRLALGFFYYERSEYAVKIIDQIETFSVKLPLANVKKP